MKRQPALPTPVSPPLLPPGAERLSAPPTLRLSGSSPPLLPPPSPLPLPLLCLLLSLLLLLLLSLSLYPSPAPLPLLPLLPALPLLCRVGGEEAGRGGGLGCLVGAAGVPALGHGEVSERPLLVGGGRAHRGRLLLLLLVSWRRWWHWCW